MKPVYTLVLATLMLASARLPAAQKVRESPPFGLNLDGRPSIVDAAPVDYVVWLTGFFTLEELFDLPLVAEESDADSDGRSNRFEYLAALDPTNGQEGFRIAVNQGESPSIEISPLNEGVNFRIEASGDLENWATVATEAYEQIGKVVRLPLNSNTGETFYRVQLLNPVPTF